MFKLVLTKRIKTTVVNINNNKKKKMQTVLNAEKQTMCYKMYTMSRIMFR